MDVIEILKLLALTLPAVAIYMQVIRRRLENQGNTDAEKRPYKQVILLSEGSLGLFSLAIIASMLSIGGPTNLFLEISDFLVFLGYFAFSGAVFWSIYQERDWLI